MLEVVMPFRLSRNVEFPVTYRRWAAANPRLLTFRPLTADGVPLSHFIRQQQVGEAQKIYLGPLRRESARLRPITC